MLPSLFQLFLSIPDGGSSELRHESAHGHVLPRSYLKKGLIAATSSHIENALLPQFCLLETPESNDIQHPLPCPGERFCADFRERVSFPAWVLLLFLGLLEATTSSFQWHLSDIWGRPGLLFSPYLSLSHPRHLGWEGAKYRTKLYLQLGLPRSTS